MGVMVDGGIPVFSITLLMFIFHLNSTLLLVEVAGRIFKETLKSWGLNDDANKRSYFEQGRS